MLPILTLPDIIQSPDPSVVPAVLGPPPAAHQGPAPSASFAHALHKHACCLHDKLMQAKIVIPQASIDT